MTRIPNEVRDETRISAAILQLLLDGGEGRKNVAEDVSRMTGIPLSASAILVMERLGLESMRVNDLGASVGVSSGAITRQIQDLENKGLMTRTSDTTDKRAAIVTLSEKGLDVIKLSSSLRDYSTRAAIQDWTNEEVQQFMPLLERLANRLHDGESRQSMLQRIHGARDISVDHWIRLIRSE